MRLFDLFSENDLQEQIDARMVKATEHPFLPLTILNYTQIAQFTPEKWNHITDICRGLIYDNQTLEVKARPFKKFWNLNDNRHPETMMENLPPSVPLITRKMDGSLGIGYRDAEKLFIATRGSFTSEQAAWANEWIKRQDLDWIPQNHTPLFEIIYPENQIVVKYEYPGLVLLAMINIETGEEVPYGQLKHLGHYNGFPVVNSFDRPICELASEDAENEEGYVVSWHDRNPPLRVKVKFETYCRLHRLLTQTNAVTVWEMLRDGLDLTTLIADVPADFKSWIDGVESTLLSSYKTIEDAALASMLEYEGEKVIANSEQRKQFALYAIAKQPLTPILFSMLDSKDYAPIIWKMIRPSGNDRTFRIDTDL